MPDMELSNEMLPIGLQGWAAFQSQDGRWAYAAWWERRIEMGFAPTPGQAEQHGRMAWEGLRAEVDG